MAFDLRLDSPELRANPFETYRRLRESEPVYWSERYQSWFLFRHADVAVALKHPGLSEKRLDAFRRLVPPEKLQVAEPAFAVMDRWILFQAGAEHAQQRRLFSHGFMPTAIAALGPLQERVAAELLNGLRGRTAFDAATEFAIPFPVTVIAELFGVRLEDRPKVEHWSDDIAYFLTSIPIPAAACDRIGPALTELRTTMESVVADRRAHPRGEFLDELIHAEEDGSVIETADLFANFSLLLFAGNETTRNLIGNGIRLLLEHPDVLDGLRREPDRWDNTVSELLRLRSSVQIVSRLAVAEVELGGKRIQPGEQVFCVLGAANHDPAVFPEPERFDIRRSNAGDHLAFGAGVHFCLGHYLAHSEGSIALRRLFEAFPTLRLDPAQPPVMLGDARLMGHTHLLVLA